jgi:hypothetical protein
MTDRRVSRANRNQKLRGRSWVYFAQEGVSGLVKIGQTRQLERRICVLNSATAGGVTLIGSIPETDVPEKRLHALLWEHRDRGEWFRPHEDVMHLARAGSAIYGDGYRHDIPEHLERERFLIHCACMGIKPTAILADLPPLPPSK